MLALYMLLEMEILNTCVYTHSAESVCVNRLLRKAASAGDRHAVAAMCESLQSESQEIRATCFKAAIYRWLLLATNVYYYFIITIL